MDNSEAAKWLSLVGATAPEELQGEVTQLALNETDPDLLSFEELYDLNQAINDATGWFSDQ